MSEQGRGLSERRASAVSGEHSHAWLAQEAQAAAARAFVEAHRGWAAQALDSSFEPLGRIDPLDLAQAGWGVVFAETADPAVRAALEPLLARRRGQAGTLFREFTGADGYRAGESKFDFLGRARVAPGPIDPRRVPYYLLLVGSGAQIPFSFQCQLGLEYAVGRLAFDTPDEYRRYALAVLDVEEGRVRAPLRAAVFGPRNPGDEIGSAAHDRLSEPLARVMRQEPGWRVDPLLGPDATRARLLELLGRPAPALLFTAGHGALMGCGDEDQEAVQGAWVCQDWDKGRDPSPSYDELVCADDLPASDRRGQIVFSLACFSAGTPQWDGFAGLEAEAAKRLAPHDFVAALPRRLLSLPEGPALAMVGHVDSAVEQGFMWLPEGDQPTSYVDAVQRLMAGEPVGRAMRPFSLRYAALSADLHHQQRLKNLGLPGDDRRLGHLWQAVRDAVGWVVLGDPAVRLDVEPDAPAAA
jgi:hypothetical protein